MKDNLIEGIFYRVDRDLYRIRTQKGDKRYLGYERNYTTAVQKLWKAQLDICPEKALGGEAIQYLLMTRPKFVLDTLGLGDN